MLDRVLAGYDDILTAFSIDGVAVDRPVRVVISGDLGDPSPPSLMNDHVLGEVWTFLRRGGRGGVALAGPPR